MRSPLAQAALTLFALAVTGCPSVDPGYVRAMEEWADKSCDCYRLPQGESQKCFDSVKEPTVPPHFLDAAIDNPNYEAAEPSKKKVEACLKGWRDREGVKVN
ncbi:MAG: hypothetical protein HOV80_09045 [Polyangiaceae bacterium]|nr:hypothetical protein [Polyangiaceae bacterium]